LTPGERREMQKHPLIGADTLLEIRRQFGDDPLVNMGIQIALSHHERWDGHGYPYGLVADQIAPAARIVALADVYDALTSSRVYKSAMGHAEAVALILSGSGTQFDPAVVEAFERLGDQFESIRRRCTPVADDAGQSAGHAMAA
jgi:putative two-component system response regulator